MLTVYAYQNCESCRKALKHLVAKGIEHEVRPIRERPPSVAELKRMLVVYQGDVRRLFNISSKDYRELKLKDRLPLMSADEALKLLTANGNLVKRPFVLAPKGALVGFDPRGLEALAG
jgi:arsenate reductase (glutaredoxin)